jgi:hypothetical protein
MNDLICSFEPAISPFKTVNYCDGACPGYVIYIIIGGDCIFSGNTSHKMHTKSTVQAAEAVITAIARQEGADVNQFTFFDLKTQRSYRREPGQYSFSRISFNAIQAGYPLEIQLRDITWKQVDCPEEVLSLFAEHIGPNPRKYIP